MRISSIHALQLPVHKLLMIACSFLILAPALAQNQPWRSELYPFSWERGYQVDGKFLHDFSYAGYHKGEKVIPKILENILDVTQAPFDADNTGTTDATAAIQAAIDSVAQLGKGVVYLPEGVYHVSPGASHALLVSHDSTVIRGAGPGKTFILNTESNMRSKTIIRFSPGSHGWYNPSGQSISFTEDAVEQDTIFHLANAAHFEEGDLIILTTDFTSDFIAEHQMTGKWTTSIDGTAFCRSVEAVDAAASTIEVDIPIRYYMKQRDNARTYRIKKQLTECGLENLSVGNIENPKSGLGESDYSSGGTAAYEVHASHAIDIRHAENCWVKQVHTFKPEANTMDIHVLSNALLLYQSRLITVDSCILQKPQYEGGGGNGYMFTLRSNDCLISNSQAIHSRHNYDFKKAYSNGNVIYNSLSKDSKYASDFHMHLSMTNLFDSHTVDGDFLEAVYRPYGSVEHGHSTTQSVFWNTTGEKYHGNSNRIISSGQWGYGYVIGTQGNATGVTLPTDNNTSPKDHLEGEATGHLLHPASLYQDQLKRRLEGLAGVDSTNWDAPVIQLVSPVHDEQVNGNMVSFEVQVLSEISAIEKVVFLEGEEEIGQVTEAPFTFSWENVPDGCYTLSAYAVTNSGSTSNTETTEILVGRGCEESYYGFAFELPGLVEAEYFNKGKNNHAYYDTDEVNQGGAYRPGEPVDIQPCSEGGYNIGWIADGEFLRYAVAVKSAGIYDVHFRVASENSGTILCKWIHQRAAGSVDVPGTNGWQKWSTVTLEGLELQQGTDTVQLNFTGSFNLNHFEVEKTPEVITATNNLSVETLIFPNPAKNQITIQAAENILAYSIIDLTGRVIMSKSVNGSNTAEVDLSALKKGVYWVRVEKRDGVYSGKLIKE